jgi:hypothetical protein
MSQKDLQEAIGVQLAMAGMLGGSDARRCLEIASRLLALYHAQQAIPATRLDY